MTTASRRLAVLGRHVGFVHNPVSMETTGRSPTITASPSVSLVDEKVAIKIQGLVPDQLVTIVANMGEGRRRFESRAVYRANEHGDVDNRTDYSMAGTFIGVQPMGLFWSMQTDGHPIQFRKIDVTTPFRVDFLVFGGVHESGELPGQPLTSTSVERMYMAAGVRRIPVKEGAMIGTIFVPEGEGPFPAILNVNGGFVPIMEERAGLLASRGCVTFTISYIHPEAPPTMEGIVNYLKEAADWFCRQPYVDETRMCLFSVSNGVYLSQYTAMKLPKVISMVNICGNVVSPDEIPVELGAANRDVEPDWLHPSASYTTDEGVVIKNVFRVRNPYLIPAWQHGAKILYICADDDFQIYTEGYRFLEENLPAQFRDNVEVLHYPGAGHMIECPNTPLARRFKLNKARMREIYFIKREFADDYIMNGGYPVQHAFAQEDSWVRILAFLNKTLGHKTT